MYKPMHLRRRNDPRGQRGFTLVELLVVLAVGVIALTGLLALVVSSLKGNQSAAASAEAVEICEESMEELRSMSVASIEQLAPPYAAITNTGWGPVAHHSGDIFGRNGVRFKRTVSARELDQTQFPNLVWIRVNVEWADEGADVDTAEASLTHLVYLEMLRNREDAL